MSYRTSLDRSFMIILLLFALLGSPAVHAADLFFSGDSVSVTGGNNYVLKGNVPDDKSYTGFLICTLSGRTDQVPASTTLTVTLLRSGVSVRTETHTYSSSDWILNETFSYYIPLYYNSNPELEYSFAMPAVGIANDQLRTGTYQFNFSITSSPVDSNTDNNAVVSDPFTYTVYSGRLLYNNREQTITALTPADSPMCPSDHYLSAVSGIWADQWWDDYFATAGLCTNGMTNSDGYSTDLYVIQNMSLAGAPTLSGHTWKVKGQAADNLFLADMRIECMGSPPSTVSLATSLQQNGLEIASFNESLTPVWQEDTLHQVYYYTVPARSYPLPLDGPNPSDLQGGSHDFISQITVTGDTTSGDDTASTPFSYTVYSGLFYFNEVETTFTDIDFDSSNVCWDGQNWRLSILSVDLSWSDIFPAQSMISSNPALCGIPQLNPDGYSMNLLLGSGEAYFGDIPAAVSGIDVILTNTFLDESGGSFASASVTLPRDVTAHDAVGSNGAIAPYGYKTIDFPGAAFSGTMEEVSLTAFPSPYLHEYGLPFYIASEAFRFRLDGSNGLEIGEPTAVYVHQEALNSLASDDLRTSFPANDILFRYGSGQVGDVVIDQNGLGGQLNFSGDDSLTLETSFPRAVVTFGNWELSLEQGRISSTSVVNMSFLMGFGQDCHDVGCSGTAANWYWIAPDPVHLTPEGAFGAGFNDIGRSLDATYKETEEDAIAWGYLNDTMPATFVRHDRNHRGAFLVPGFLMSGTSDQLAAPNRLGQVLLGSYDFTNDQPAVFHALHDQTQPAATLGDGIFAGINLGPEDYTSLDVGIGSLLDNATWIHFYEPPSTPSSHNPVPMADSEAVKYVLRPGGLTGVFNTLFNAGSDGLVNVYGYDLAFDRFAFRQDRNVLDKETFIDGKLTLQQGPVADGSTGSHQDFEVSFVNLDLTCNGNLASGTVDAEPEPTWPVCEGEGDHKACQQLVYWNMPVLLTAMGFENDPDADAGKGMCPTVDRQLTIHTRNQVDGLGQPLDMSAMYGPDGTLAHQKMFGKVETWFDKPQAGSKPGFGVRLRTAYLNEVHASLESWSGFTVLAGLTDVPLFNDTRLAGHFDNQDPADTTSYNLYIFQDETDGDGTTQQLHDGVPDTYNVTVPAYRELLSSQNQAAPKPFFQYSWPTDNMVALNYYADYRKALDGEMPWFQGEAKDIDVLGVVDIKSVPEYINPEKTKFSFGASAKLAALQNFQIDLSDATESLDEYLHNVLGVSAEFSMEDVLCSDKSGSRICLNNVEQDMLALTGGDLTSAMGSAVETLMKQDPLAAAVSNSAQTLNLAHQAPAQINGMLMEPLRSTREALLTGISTNLKGTFTELYTNNYLAAVAVFDQQSLQQIVTGQPTESELAAMTVQVEEFRGKLDILVNGLAAGITDFDKGIDALTRSGGVLSELTVAIGAAQTGLQQLEENINTNMAVLESSDPAVNPLLEQVNSARQQVSAVRDAIQEVDLITLGKVLQAAAAAGGSSIDTSLIEAAQQTVKSSLAELDTTINQAESALDAVYGSLPLSGVLSQVRDLIRPGVSGNVYDNLNILAASLGEIGQQINKVKMPVHDNLTALYDKLAALQHVVDGEHPVDSNITSWNYAQDAARIILDKTARAVFQDQNNDFPTLFEGRLAALAADPFAAILDDTTSGGLPEQLKIMMSAVTMGLPQPSEQDIRNMIRVSVVNAPAVAQVNQVFFTQFGVLSDQFDVVSTQMTDRMNGLIRQTIDAVNEARSQQLAGEKTPVGGWDLQAIGLDGYAIISQDEFERMHMGADFSFGGGTDPTTYNAALDVTSWNAENGKTGCVSDGEEGKFFDVTISTHDVTADMLGMNVGIKSAMLGFTIDSNANPIGILGNCYLDGEINFEVLVLEDLGLEVGVGSMETYFGATGAGRFQEYRIPKAAFFVGKSCDFDVLTRLDPEVAEFIGPFTPLTGIYARGSVSIPIYNGGCWFTVGAGVDVGAWYFTQPSPGTFGGLLGGSAYGSLGCLASVKGMIRCMGQKSGTEYKFAGSGWAGAGIGFCSPGSWQNVGDVRSDSWCVTGDASFGATYLMDDGLAGDLTISGPSVHCCD